jgi:hypothetical protein
MPRERGGFDPCMAMCRNGSVPQPINSEPVVPAVAESVTKASAPEVQVNRFVFGPNGCSSTVVRVAVQ